MCHFVHDFVLSLVHIMCMCGVTFHFSNSKQFAYLSACLPPPFVVVWTLCQSSTSRQSFVPSGFLNPIWFPKLKQQPQSSSAPFSPFFSPTFLSNDTQFFSALSRVSLCPTVSFIAISLQTWQMSNSDSLLKSPSHTVRLQLAGNASPSIQSRWLIFSFWCRLPTALLDLSAQNSGIVSWTAVHCWCSCSCFWNCTRCLQGEISFLGACLFRMRTGSCKTIQPKILAGCFYFILFF